MIENVAMVDVPVETAPEQEPITVNGTIRMTIDFEADLVALRKRYPKEYADIDMRGYEEWERGSVFLHQFLADSVEFYLHGGDGVKERWSDVDDIDYRWTKEQAEQLELIPKESAATVEKAAN